MREIGLRAIAALCEQVYDKADAVLLDSYRIILFAGALLRVADKLISTVQGDDAIFVYFFSE